MPSPTRFLTALLAALLGAGLGFAAPASAAATGHVRLAHLSPDTPAVDVYLTAVSGKPRPKMFPAVGYGVVSPYMPLPTGQYTVAMRKAGAAESTPPVLSTSVTVAAGKAYTVAGVGRYADLGLKVIPDDLTAPRSGRVRLRAIHASVRVPNLGLAVVDGPTLFESATFATTSAYRDAPAGRWTLRIQPTSGDKAVTVKVSLKAGAVYSLLILDGKDGKLTVVPRLDAQGMPVMPAGPVDAGAGGASGADRVSVVWLAALLLTVSLITVVAIRLARPRRSRHIGTTVG